MNMNPEPDPLRRCWLLAAAALALGPAAAGAAGTEWGTLIDIAGSQRMLSQRIVKAYCQIGLGALLETSRAQLQASLRRFETQLAELKRGAPTAATRAMLLRVDGPWQRVRRTARGPVTREGARRLALESEELLRAAHAVVVVLQDAAAVPHARLVNISGRERMLSQRLAKAYMLRAWGLDSPALRDEMDITAHEFSGALQTLRDAPENTPAIDAELEGVTVQWEWFKAALAAQGAESHALVVADSSEAILEGMELVTGLYAKLATSR
jgi:hypothetical protein